MTRRLRILYNVIALSSLAVCVAALAIWARSSRQWDRVIVGPHAWRVIATTDRGVLAIDYASNGPFQHFDVGYDSGPTDTPRRALPGGVRAQPGRPSYALDLKPLGLAAATTFENGRLGAIALPAAFLNVHLALVACAAAASAYVSFRRAKGLGARSARLLGYTALALFLLAAVRLASWFWLTCILLLVAASTWPRIRAAVTTARRPAAGTCPTCGYDLRATPTRCPECGTIPAPPPA